ncbi:MAG: DUF493 domain-containing protein [Oleibacter sp.]|nr:DUF493 domain-containing protein [Thalassolituus sp.]
MSEPSAPKIEFPCPDYPIKVVGVASDDYDTVIVDIVRVHAPECDLERMRVQESSNGRFRSITLYIVATSPEQLQQMHRDLMAHPQVKMVI